MPTALSTWLASCVTRNHVLDQGCDSITLFGTTGEGFSIGMRERAAMIGAVLAGGIEARKLNAGVTATTVADAVEQSRLALDFGANGLLLAPPYYFKGPDDDGLFQMVFGCHRGHRCGRTRRDPLPHPRTDCGSPVGRPCRPPQAGVPGVIAGVKDSSGDKATAEAFLAAHGELAILVGDERQLAGSHAQGRARFDLRIGQHRAEDSSAMSSMAPLTTR